MNRLAAAGALSLAVHSAVLWGLFHPTSPAMPGTAEPPELEVEFVDQAAETRGAATPPVAAPPPATAQPSRPDDPAGTEAVSSPAPPVPPREAPPGPASRYEVNLDGGEHDRESLLVTGADVVPPRPDAAIHNRPPAYPADAARRHVQGTVGLVIHVTALGTPAWVEIAESSGDAALDDAARDAVSTWRFRPATDRGIPVPFDFAYKIRFTLDQDRRSPNGQDRPRFDTGR